LGQRAGAIRAFDEQEELNSTTEEDVVDDATKKSPLKTVGPATRNFSKLPLDNSTSFSEYDAHLLETSMISSELKSSFVEDENEEKSHRNNLFCDEQPES
jgi:hypothetical protein